MLQFVVDFSLTYMCVSFPMLNTVLPTIEEYYMVERNIKLLDDFKMQNSLMA